MGSWSSLLPCRGCCKEFWIPSPGASGPFCLGILGYAPSAVAIVIFVLRYALRPAWRYRPQWLRDFASEKDHLGDDESATTSPKAAPFTAWSIALLLLAIVNIGLSIAGVLLFLSPFHSLSLIPSLLSALVLLVDRPQSTPGAVLVLNALTFFDSLMLLAVAPPNLTSGDGIIRLVEIGVVFVSIVAILNMPLRDRRMLNNGISQPFTPATVELRSPEDNMTLWQWMSVSWMAPLISVGLKRQIHDEDVWLLPFAFHHDRLHLLFREVKGSVLGRLLKANAPDLMTITSLGLLETSLEAAEVLFLKYLLASISADYPNYRGATLWACVIFLARFIRGQSGVFSLWFSRRTYERSRGEMITMIYEKTLRRKAFTFPNAPDAEKVLEAGDEQTSESNTAVDSASENEDTGDIELPPSKPSAFAWFSSCFGRGYKKVDAKPPPPPPQVAASGPSSTGKILNLMRNDVYEVAQRFWEFPSLFTKPLSLILSLALLWQFLGPASLVGVLILICCQLINAYFLRWLVRVERTRRTITDTKLQRTSQFVESIRHLRWYDWQNSWLDGILESRQAELNKRVLTNIITKSVTSINHLGAYTFPVVAFLGFTLVSGNDLTVDIAFPSLDIFSMIQNSLRDLPGLITVLLNANVAMGRIEGFMAEPNKEDALEAEAVEPLGELEIEMKDASFSWPGSTKKVLKHVSILCKQGLTVVCGKVGIGKTALLHAILGELDQDGGEKHVSREPIGYCTQTPWLQSMSIRENILFSSPYDEVRYRKTLDACCLIPDLADFKAGDLSLIGENGVGLSGGQRARVALARAIYSPSRILLLDDPIAALDHQTAESILRKLFAKKNTSLMAGRLVVFVTHRVDLISIYADQVLDVVDGGMVKTISREELEKNEELQHLAATAAAHHDAAEDEAEHAENTAIPDKFIEEEYRAHGGVMASVYWKYVKAGGLSWWAVTIIFFILFRVARVFYFWFLKIWGEAYNLASDEHIFTIQRAADIHPPMRMMDSTFWDRFDFSKSLPSPEQDVRPWLWWFLFFSLAQFLAQSLSDLPMIVIVYNAGKNLFQDAMKRVSNATFRFYDVTPVGRLMNRLTSDIGTVDGQICYQLMDVSWYAISWLSSVVVIGSTTPLFLGLTIVMTGLFVYIFMRFLPTSQSLRRLEMVSLSPLMSNFGTLLEGLTTVRAFKAQPHFQHRIIVTTDAFQKMDHFYWSLQSWLQYRFDMLSALTTFLLTMTAIYTRLSGGTIGFVLSAASNFVISTHVVCRKYGELQMQFVSVERVIELLDLEQESEGEVKPPSAWPTYGDDIEFDHVTLRYAPSLEPSLIDVSFRIPAGSSVAVTGRTGSGKSTLALSLLATILPDPVTGGAIRIGNIDLSTVDKHCLRRSISFVAQDPVLFPGTLRDNLDPVSEHSDEECAAVLARVLRDGDFTLQSRVDGGGKNLSQGQRQLVGLGRAILRRSPVVIMDEATASIDVQTAFEIQEVLREELRQSTVITIAHRVEAVRDANYEIVLEKGKILRCGPI
ncbi:P-loop containing nucleoside triphosphate hydrolase protein [Thozetella sp. PMI_491]|nr:P-loop containing nucleoside triphosphate hydrolase protein [Thozetella sp. PMI_491]